MVMRQSPDGASALRATPLPPARQAGPIPLEVLFGRPDPEPLLSPDGSLLGWIAPYEGVLNAWIAPVSMTAGVDWPAARVVTDGTGGDIRHFAWAHDGEHLLYLQDADGDEDWRLRDVHLTSMQHRDLTPFAGVQTQIVGMDPRRPHEVLLGLNLANPELHDVYRLDLRTGQLTKEIDNPGFIGWAADADLQVRAALAPQPDGSYALMVRDYQAPWRELLRIPAEDADGTEIAGFSADGRSLLVITSMNAPSCRLVRADLDTGVVSVLAEDAEADVCAVKTHPATGQPQIAAVLKARTEYHVLDPGVADDLDAILAIHPGDPVIQNGDDADQIWLVGFTNDSGPVPYFAYDRGTGESRFLFENQPELARYELAVMEPYSYRARDGLTIHGYATFPPGKRLGLPTVLFVHGGPWDRDTWGYSPQAQWLASRGYLCLQVNYRGSAGYGRAFLDAGDREWGARMQDDLSDAVAHAVAEKWADPARVAIFGGSYGGYAALAGVAFTPDLYRCAVDIVGPSNLITLIRSIPPYWAPLISTFHRRVGNPDSEAEFLWARSPLSQASQIRVPLFIVQGANDPRVKQAESEQLVDALRAAGIEHQYLLFPDEGHGFTTPQNRLRFYAEAEQFLARHLLPVAAPPPAAVRHRAAAVR
jgi:dipeptidyl aminopeptidase/acylaminoacyl peptidase